MARTVFTDSSCVYVIDARDVSAIRIRCIDADASHCFEPGEL